MSINYFPEPFRIKVVEPIKMLTREERIAKIQAANYNVFALDAEDVYIDLLTDSGTNAMSSNQWAGIMLGDESYSGASSYKRLVKSAQDVFGYKFIQPVHQGRAAEKVVMPIFLSKGKYSISNMHFDTTRAHVELTGARAIDCTVKEATDTMTYYDFKGNMDTTRLEKYILELGPENIGLIIMTITNNSAGGQPVSLANIIETGEIAHKYGITYAIDAARFAENSYFIKKREPACKEMTIQEIVLKTFACADLFMMSSKKDAIVNIGGLIGIKNREDIYKKVKANTIPNEGFVTYGGLSGRDLEAIAIGLKEGMDYDYLQYRIGQMEYLGEKLVQAGVAIQYPAGGHAIFVDAKKMFPHIPYYEFPAQALTVELYIEAGIRACDIGSYMLGNDPDTGKQLEAEFEFTRLAIPRRVYTQAHLDVVAQAVINISSRADQIKGLKIVEEETVLRHFTAKLERL